ncbi:hypothetical protein [Methylomonas koyamae]|uniref:hypothetical protein n=1 Tax=Methylomonas koyamae TaxID=702114 RepID=UPI000A7F3683|nr:hypothetical protein [Methylomonas koyamae]
MSVFPRLFPSYRLFLAIALLPMLNACSSRPTLPGQEEQFEKLQQAMQSGAYRPAGNFELDSARDRWLHGGVELDVEMLAPKAAGSYPLVIYLPSIGEDAGAGRLWRESWAKAGYAVFSVQPVEIAQALKQLEAERKFDLPDADELAAPADADENGNPERESGGESWFGEKRPRQSRSARSSELHYVGHQYFAPDRLQSRLGHLYWAYRQLKLRAEMRVPVFAAADFSKVVLAGYDLGGQTVSAAAGEAFAGDMPDRGDWQPVAAIVLSPSVDLAEGQVRGRFQKLTLPMLSITGSEDNDPYAISSAPVRTALWEYAPAGGKYLLLLQGGGHKVLAGSELGGRFAAAERRNDAPLAEGLPPGVGRRRGGMGGPQAGGESWFGGSRTEETRRDQGYKQVAAVIGTTTAFLDMVVKNDVFAQAWLQEKANPWLGRSGSLKSR